MTEREQTARGIRNLLVLAAVFCMFLLAPRALAAVTVNDFAGLKDALAAGETDISLAAGDYEVTEMLEVTGGVTLSNQGKAVLTRVSAYPGTMLHIRQGASLTLKSQDEGLVLDGMKIQCEESKMKGNAGMVLCEGTLVLDGAVIRNDKARGGSYLSPVQMGKHSRLDMLAGAIRDNDYSGRQTAYAVGGVRLQEGALMTMKGGSVSGNQGSNFQHGSLLWSDSPGCGGIMVDHGAKLVMDGGVVSGNKGYAGGIMVGDACPYNFDRGTTDPSKLKRFPMAIAILNGGVIKENGAVLGGGVACCGNAEVIMPKDSGVVIEKNRGYQGGGLGVLDEYVFGITNKTFAKVPLSEWKKVYAARLEMLGGIVRGNYAAHCGGGVYVASDGGHLAGGLIENNRAGDQGGGVYLATIPYALRIEKAYIENNTASGGGAIISDGIILPGGSGGGVWFCPTGDAQFYAENGVVFADNAASLEGHDFWSSQKVQGSGKNYIVTLPDRLISGAKVAYYEDLAGSRYQAGTSKQVTDIKNVSDKISVKAVMDKAGMRAAKALSTLIIRNNRASKGGGFGSNGTLIFGRVPYHDNPLKTSPFAKYGRACPSSPSRRSCAPRPRRASITLSRN